MSIFLETKTDLIRNYTLIRSADFNGDLTEVRGKYLWLVALCFLLVLLATAVNFYLLFKKQTKGTKNWYKFLWPFLGTALAIPLAIITLLGYYQLLPFPFLSAALLCLMLAFPFVYSAIKYDLFLEDTKILFGKNFLQAPWGCF